MSDAQRQREHRDRELARASVSAGLGQKSRATGPASTLDKPPDVAEASLVNGKCSSCGRAAGSDYRCPWLSCRKWFVSAAEAVEMGKRRTKKESS